MVRDLNRNLIHALIFFVLLVVCAATDLRAPALQAIALKRYYLHMICVSSVFPLLQATELDNFPLIDVSS